jgi:5,6,7,8-tetrahydromethanopterin hydro-lyase
MDITTMEIGEAFVGNGGDAAHINTVLGPRSGPVGAAWATGLACPTDGHARFLVAAQPGVMAMPPTLFVNKATITGPDHGRMTWGPAQAGVAKGIAGALEEGVIDRAGAGDLLIIAAVWVDPAAADESAVFANNAEATQAALRNGQAGKPAVEDAIEAGLSPWNPFYRP